MSADAESLPGKPGERAGLVLGVVLLYLLGYFALGLTTDPARARELATPLDAWFPFVPETIFLYASVFAASSLPAFVIRCPRLFRRVALVYTAMIAISLACFGAFPVTSLELRADLDVLDPPGFTGWGMRLLYHLDPPFNLFPSLHLSVAMVAALSTWTARRSWGVVALVWVAGVTISVLTVKQHFVLDALAGTALGAVFFALWIRPYRPEPGTEVSYSWRGPLAFGLGLAGLLAGFYALYRSGWTL